MVGHKGSLGMVALLLPMAMAMTVMQDDKPQGCTWYGLCCADGPPAPSCCPCCCCAEPYDGC